MADKQEPPPFDDDENDSMNDTDDLFASTIESSNKETNHIPADEHLAPISLDNSNEDIDDIFADAAAGAEVNLNSDNEDDVEKTVKLDELEKPVPATRARKSVTDPAPDPDPISLLAGDSDDSTANDSTKAESEPPKMGITETMTSTVTKKTTTRTIDEIEEISSDQTLKVMVTDPQKMGDGMSAYMVYKVTTKTSIAAFKRPEMSVVRRFSDFLGLHSRLVEKHVHLGRIVPPAPEKSVLGMTKIKMSKEEAGSADFVEKRRASLERFLQRIAAHPVLYVDPDFRDFLEQESDLPKSSSTSALSGAGVMRLFHRIGDSVEKMTFKMDESDEWFEEKQQQVEALDQQLRKLHTNLENLVQHRKELSVTTAAFAKSAAMLGNAEEHTALSRALSQLAEMEERIEQIHREQAEHDFFTMAELLKDYIALLSAVKDVFHERVKSYKIWKDAELTLTKKREMKAKLEVQHKTDKIPQVQQEIKEWESKVDKGQEDFEKLSETIRKEVQRFDKGRVEDFKTNVILYLESLMENQQQLIKYWEAFLPEAKAIA